MSELSWRLFECQGSIRAGFRNSLSLGLSCILVLLLVLPPLTRPAAPALEGEVVLQAIEANQERQSRLLREEVSLPTGEDKLPAAASEAEKELEESPQATATLPESTGSDLDSADTEAEPEEEATDAEPSSTANSPATEAPATDPGAAEDPDSYSNPYGYSSAAVKALQNLNLVIVGDSVMAMAMEGMQAYVPEVYIDAAVSRHFYEGPAIIQAIDNSGIAADFLVVALATNGDINPPDLDRYYDVANGRPLIFVNTVVPGTWEQPNNQKLANYAASHDQVYIADWYGRAKNVAAYFYQDATHPVPEGADVYDQVILETLLAVLGVQP